MSQNIGKVVEIIGPVVDIQFSQNNLPDLLTAIEIERPNEENLIVEVEQDIGADRVRCIAMGSTDGLVRGMDAIDTKKPIQAPVGENVLGRMFNVLGKPIDGLGDVDAQTMPIHRKAPAFDEQQANHWKQVLKLLTYYVLTQRVVRLDCSVVPE